MTRKIVLPPDPEEQNDARAEAARGAVQAFARDYGETDSDGDMSGDLLQQNLQDLLCDIAHLCDREGLELCSLLRVAAGHYTEETEDDDGKSQGTQLFSDYPEEVEEDDEPQGEYCDECRKTSPAGSTRCQHCTPPDSPSLEDSGLSLGSYRS